MSTPWPLDPATPATLYAAGDGVFKSTNGGESWTQHAPRPVDAPFTVALAIDPSAPSTHLRRRGLFDWRPGRRLQEHRRRGELDGHLRPPKSCRSSPSILRRRPRSMLALAQASSRAPTAGRAGRRPACQHCRPCAGRCRRWRLVITAPATVYAGTEGGGVFKRPMTSGWAWTAINAGLIASFVYALAIDPTTPATLYAGTYGGGVFKSRNGGKSWTASNAGLTNLVVSALAIDPTAPATLYAGTFSGFPGGVFKSTDGGESWRAIDTGLTSSNVTSLVIDPSAPATVYVGAGFGVFKSINGGESWTDVSTGLTEGYDSVYGLVIDPSAPATLYALTNGRVFKSTNGGANWTEVLGHPVSALAVDPSTSTHLYAVSNGFFEEHRRRGELVGPRHRPRQYCVAGHRSIRPGDALCWYVRRRCVQEHGCWHDLDRVQRRTWEFESQCPGHRSCGADQALRRHGRRRLRLRLSDRLTFPWIFRWAATTGRGSCRRASMA